MWCNWYFPAGEMEEVESARTGRKQSLKPSQRQGFLVISEAHAVSIKDERILAMESIIYHILLLLTSY